MFALAHVMHFLADEFTRLRAGRLSFLFIFASALDCFTFRHKEHLLPKLALPSVTRHQAEHVS